MIFVSALDGLYGFHPLTRSCLLTLAAITYGYNVVWARTVEDCTVQIDFLGEYGDFSVRERIASSSQILLIFLAKQAFVSWIKGTRNRCVAVKYSPGINWEHADSRIAASLKPMESKTDTVDIVYTDDDRKTNGEVTRTESQKKRWRMSIVS